jgi:DNA primase
MNRTNVEEIKARIPIEELIGSYVKVEKSGKSYKTRCPFHNEKTASFFISPERGGYYCFGCGAKGDIFSFVEQFEGLDFKGALKILAERAGIPLVVDQKTDSERDQLFKITEEVAKYFEEQFSKSKEAQDYIKGRGIKPETRQAFRIGWAPEGWQNLLNYLKKKGWNENVIEKAGFIKKSEKNDDGLAKSRSQISASHTPSPVTASTSVASRYYDRFRGRVIFPITDSSGRVVAFTGRILHDDGKSAKYLNSPETPIFTKSQILFGLDKAKSEIKRLNYSILVEGQMDLVLSHQVGVKNTIAASGTALTDQVLDEAGVVSNLGMVRRLSPNMIIALDSDKAGRTATMRAVAATALGMGMSVKIADASADGYGGKDPADLIMQDPEIWKNVLKNAKHVIEFELTNIMRDVADPRLYGRSIRDRIFPFLSKIDSDMDKAYYLKIIAEKAKLNEQSVWDDLRKYEKANKAQVVTQNSQNNISSNNLKSGSNNSIEKTTNRFDLVERRMFGLLQVMENGALAGEQGVAEKVKGYRERVKKIAGNNYEEIIKRITPILSDVTFEAESLYGNDKGRLEIHMKELLKNFELDFINDELSKAMTDLRQAEKDGKNDVVAELAKKCQVLSIRKAELGKVGM